MFEMPILSLLIMLPLLAIFVVLVIRGNDESVSRHIRYIATLTSFMYLILSLYLWYNFDKIFSDYQFTESVVLIPSINFGYNLGIDGISLLFIIFSSILFNFVFLFIKFPKNNVKMYTISLLVIMSASVGTFASTDMIMFYVFYELSIIPVFFIIGIFGEHNKIYATFKFFLYTIFGSIFMIISIIFIVFLTEDANMGVLSYTSFDFQHQKYLFLGLFIAFAVKSALFPFHTWLPDTYESSPLYLNILLSGILMKYGLYGFIKFVLPVAPLAIEQYLYIIYFICLFTLVYTGLIALKSTNVKRLFAYFSISHVALMIAGVFSATTQGVEGAIFQGLSHSMYSLGIFLALIYLQSRTKGGVIDNLVGLGSVMPKFAILFFIFSLTAMSFPLTNAFIGEILVLFGIFQNNRLYASGFALSMIISALVMISFNRNFIFSEVSSVAKSFKDLSLMESIPLVLIVLIILLMGIYPDTFLDIMHTSVSNIIDQFKNEIITNKNVL